MHAASSRRFIWLALLLALFQTAMPVAAYAQSLGAGGLLVEICVLGGGKKLVSMGVNGAPDESTLAAGENHASHCPLCSGTAAAPAAADAVHVPAPDRTLRSPSRTSAPSTTTPGSPPATGPPAFS